MPGLRLGFTYAANAAWNEHVDRELPIWNVNALAERVIELVLKHRTALTQSFVQTVADREQLRQLLLQVPDVVVGDSGGNFVVAKLATPALAERVAHRLLQEHRLHVKDASAKLGTGALRIAVRTPIENATFVERFAAIYGEEQRGGS
jgi:histidinol-phosphate/aromatic aminotransferase/cobyric acid decarboxylase-like protein